MPIDKTWTTIENRNSDEFSRGLKSFVERSKAHVDGRGLIRCPCRKCVNSDFVKISTMEAHIERFGFSRRYITWVYHGESIAPPIVDDVTPRNEMAGVIDDVMGENDTNHGGDGREDPPPSGGQGRGQHEMDVVPPRRRGKAKNLSLFTKWENNGKRPLPLEFDDHTSTTVGETHDLFIREIGVYIWRDISLDRDSWKKVSPAEKNAMFQHLRPYFDLERVMEDSTQSRLKEGLEYMISARYRGRKTKAKEHFMRNGGYEDVERVRATPPIGMSDESWNKAVDFFTSEKHVNRSTQNKANRAKQVIKNRGGTSSYSSACFKKKKSRLQAFHDAHVNQDGQFDNPITEEQYNALVRELAEQTQLSATSSNPTPVDEPTIFEKVLGSRRGHIKGIRHKPSTRTSSSAYSEGHSHTSPHTHVQMELDVEAILSNPAFRAGIAEIFQSLTSQNVSGGSENKRNERDERDEENDDSNGDE